MFVFFFSNWYHYYYWYDNLSSPLHSPEFYLRSTHFHQLFMRYSLLPNHLCYNIMILSGSNSGGSYSYLSLLVFHLNLDKTQEVVVPSFHCWLSISGITVRSQQVEIHFLSVTGVTQSSLTALCEQQVVNIATRIVADDTPIIIVWRIYPSAFVSKISNCHLQNK